MHLLTVGLLTGAVCLIAAGSVEGQVQNRRPGYTPTNRGTVSPFINLSRRTTPGINYFGIIRPERQIRGSISRLQERVALDEEMIQDVATGEAALPTTGHAAYFQNYSHYFPGMYAQGTVTHRAPSALAPPVQPVIILGRPIHRR
jgi:hypothetical protein